MHISKELNFPHASGKSIGEAWYEGFSQLMEGEVPDKYLTIHVSNAISDVDPPETTDIENWESILKHGRVYEEYTSFDFGTATDYDGTTGRDWVVVESTSCTKDCTTTPITSE